MPHFEDFSVKEPEDMANFIFDDPADIRQFRLGGDDQINCVGDVLLRNIPSWSEWVNSYVDDIPVFGSICECYEYVWRIVGTENALMWPVLELGLFEAFINRVGDFLVEFLGKCSV